jgi:hypothetical protein
MSFIESIVKKVVTLSPRFKKRTFDPEAMSIEDINLPESLMRVSFEPIQKIIENEVSIYKSLGYKDKPMEKLKVPEYHSYQIGILLRYIKEDRVFLIHNLKELVPSFILGASIKELHIKIFDIVYRYDLGVNKELTIEDLKKQLKWTPREMGYILRYLTLEDRTITQIKQIKKEKI